ncbi:MAG: hypothetical protein R6V30_08165 [Paracoccaceae bacterium]
MIHHPLKYLALTTAFVITWSSGASAQTAPNTTITNTIDLTYNSGDGTPDVTVNDAATVTFLVDRKVDLGVTAQAAGGQVTAVQGKEGVALAVRVDNLGNDTQGFVIDVSGGGTIGGGSGLTYSETATTDAGSYYVVISSDAALGGDTVYNTNTAPNAGDLAPGEEFYVLIVANVPTGASDGQFDDFTVTATATDAGTATAVVEDRTQGLSGVDTVFADAATNSTRQTGVEIDEGLNGKDADETRLFIAAPTISATKEAVVLDEMLPDSSFVCATGGAATGTDLAAIPGACVEYTITVTNGSTSGTAASNIVITDALPANTTFAGTSTGGFTSVSNAGTTVTGSLATLAANASASFTIRVTID